jgi:hypothetical protein
MVENLLRLFGLLPRYQPVPIPVRRPRALSD